MKDLKHILRILCCPSCKGELEFREPYLFCPNCEQKFPINNNIPYLLDAESKRTLESKKDKNSYHSFRKNRWADFLRRLFTPSHPWDCKLLQFCSHKDMLSSFLSNISPSSLVLNLGSGTTKANANTINLDIEAFENVSVVGDGHKLPFRDQTFDVVISISVLEHVNHPQKVVKEIHRVLKRGGYVFISVPFLFPFHASPGTQQDFSRWTHIGLEELFSSFEKIKLEQDKRTSIAVVSILSEYLALLFTDNDMLYWRLQRFFAWFFFPLFHLLDIIISKRSKSYHISHGFYFIGKKKEY